MRLRPSFFPLRPSAVIGALITLLTGDGCATFQNTPAQDLAWERWEKCNRFATIQLKEIRPNGEVWVTYTEWGVSVPQWQECMHAALEEQKKAGRLAAGAQPPVSASDARGLVRFAYFTDQPPPPGTFLRTTFGRNMPPEIPQFSSGPVTFFYAIKQVGRILSIDLQWIGPDGSRVKSATQIIDQTGRSGSWTWRTHTLEASELRQSGEWKVELRIDQPLVGAYAFVLEPK